MTADWQKRRPRLARRCTLVAEPDVVRLIADEEWRYTLRESQLDAWLPDWLRHCDGRLASELLAQLPPERRAAGERWLTRLYGERILVDAVVADVFPPRPRRLNVLGTGALAERLRCLIEPTCGNDIVATTPEASVELPILCQDKLDYWEALEFNRLRRSATTPWLWASTGPGVRGWVSPLFLPDAGPCLACLVRAFQRLSPAPELYTSLVDHARSGGTVEAADFPAAGTAILAHLACWKGQLAGSEPPAAALFRLHVLEVTTLEVSSYPVYLDPECPACGATG